MDKVKWLPKEAADGTFTVQAVLVEGETFEVDLVAVIESSGPEEAKKRAALCAGSKNMYSTLRAIKARLDGEWDNPHLMAMGPSGTTNEDIMAFVEKAIKEVKDNL